MHQRNQSGLFIPGNFKVQKVELMGANVNLPFSVRQNGILIDTHSLTIAGPDTIVTINLQ